MITICILAYPTQAINIQTCIEQNDVLTTVDTVNCLYAEIVSEINKLIEKHNPQKYVISGNPLYYSHIKEQLEKVFDIKIEEYND